MPADKPKDPVSGEETRDQVQVENERCPEEVEDAEQPYLAGTEDNLTDPGGEPSPKDDLGVIMEHVVECIEEMAESGKDLNYDAPHFADVISSEPPPDDNISKYCLDAHQASTAHDIVKMEPPFGHLGMAQLKAPPDLSSSHSASKDFDLLRWILDDDAEIDALDQEDEGVDELKAEDFGQDEELDAEATTSQQIQDEALPQAAMADEGVVEPVLGARQCAEVHCAVASTSKQSAPIVGKKRIHDEALPIVVNDFNPPDQNHEDDENHEVHEDIPDVKPGGGDTSDVVVRYRGTAVRIATSDEMNGGDIVDAILMRNSWVRRNLQITFTLREEFALWMAATGFIGDETLVSGLEIDITELPKPGKRRKMELKKFKRCK